jgi:hypothetical protein
MSRMSTSERYNDSVRLHRGAVSEPKAKSKPGTGDGLVQFRTHPAGPIRGIGLYVSDHEIYVLGPECGVE